MTDPRPAYLARLDAALVGPGRVRRELVREVADHLDDATDALVRGGLDEAVAARRAVADFGTVEEVSASFQSVLAVAASRRTARLLLLVLGCQPFLWDAGLDLGSRTRATRADSALVRALDVAVEVGGGVVIACALLALLATGIGTRWWPVGHTASRATGLLALAAAAYLPAACLAMTLAAGGATVGSWVLGTTLVVLPMLGVAVSARHALVAQPPRAEEDV